MKLNRYLFLPVLAPLFLSSCGSDEKPKTDTAVHTDSLPQPGAPQTAAAATTTAPFRSVSPYYFEPDTSVIEGVIEMEMAWGPPGYGEDTVNDMREHIAILTPDRPVDILANPADPGSDFNASVTKQDRIQLAFMNTADNGSYGKKHYRLTGAFFGAHTGHHHTPVLMAVTRVEEITKK